MKLVLDKASVKTHYRESEVGLSILTLSRFIGKDNIEVEKRWNPVFHTYTEKYDEALEELNAKILLKDDNDFSLDVTPLDGDYTRTKYTMTHKPTNTVAEMSIHSSDYVQNLSGILKEDIARKLGV